MVKKKGIKKAGEPTQELRREIAKKVRIGARIDNDLYVICKLAYNRQGLSMESRIEELLRRDIEAMSKNQWFNEMMSSDLFIRYVTKAKSDDRSGSSSIQEDQFDNKYGLGGDGYEPV